MLFCVNNEGYCIGADEIIENEDLTDEQADLLQAWMTHNVDMDIWHKVRVWATIEEDGSSHLWLCTEFTTLQTEDNTANEQMDRLAEELFPDRTHRNYALASGMGILLEDYDNFPCIFNHGDGTQKQYRMTQYSLDIDVLGMTPEEVAECSQSLYEAVQTDEWAKTHSVTVC